MQNRRALSNWEDDSVLQIEIGFLFNKKTTEIIYLLEAYVYPIWLSTGNRTTQFDEDYNKRSDDLGNYQL